MAEIKNIINTDLKLDLNKNVFEQIATSSNNLSFISQKSKECILSYLSVECLENSKELWKNLLIDSICILKVNDEREKICDDSKKDKSLLISNFESIRKSSSYGIGELYKYFDDFIDFESVLYGTNKHYRDHVGHVLKVWAIGIGIIDSNKIIFKDGYILMENFDYHFEIPEEVKMQESDENIIKKDLVISKSELWAMWTVIALCHDLGYPIEKTSEINKQAKKIISHFGNMNFSELNYSFDIFNSFLVDKFLNIISSKANIKLVKTSIQTKVRDKISKSLEDYQHGVFSSLLIFKNLTYFLETDYNLVDNELSPEDLRQFHIRKEILRAIAGHTCPKIYHLKLNTLSFLLILCDELQEWNRPKFNELTDNAISKAPISVILKEYSMKNDQLIHIEFKYDFDCDKDYYDIIVLRKFKNIHNLLRSAKDDKNRMMIFNWDLGFTNKIFKLNFDSKRNSFEFMRFYESHKETDSSWSEYKNFDIY